MSFWKAIAFVLPEQWSNPRKHMLVKGVAVYALMSLAGLLVCEAKKLRVRADFDFFVGKLSDFVDSIDWSNEGALRGYGGVSGADAALQMMLLTRTHIFKRLSVSA